ncbi:MAG TPA: riboflavin synthase [Methylomirabilota bacterium]|jgi:riboflavin synthase|nr:riboflavin synthase [Methylomirabilota bacterium]
MFTGLVEAMGSVESVSGVGAGRRLTVRVPATWAAETTVGDSVAVNGACLTVVAAEPGRLAFDLAEETLRVTTLGALIAGEPVNLERPLRFGGRLGGHLVLGHVDGVGRVTRATPEGTGRRLTVGFPPALRGLLIPKGSVAVDGVSLTVADLEETQFSVALIPHTLAVTTLGAREVGTTVNLEVDVLGKYVRALLPGGDEARRFLVGHGLLAGAGEGR